MNVNHKIYVSRYFDLIDIVENHNVIPVLIHGQKPEWYKGLKLIGFIPDKYILEIKDYDEYKTTYMCEVLGRLSPTEIAERLCEMANTIDKSKPVVLVINDIDGKNTPYEMIMDWFHFFGIDCSDYSQMLTHGKA